MTGLAVGFLVHSLWLHEKTVRELVIISLVSLSRSYTLWFLGALIINSIRIPSLLDAESGEQINALETRALSAESKIFQSEQTTKENKRLHDLFGHLAEGGAQFSRDLAQCQTPAHFASWDRHFNGWLEEVQIQIMNMGFRTDAAEFARAGESAAPVTGVMDFRNEQERRRRILTKHQDSLAGFVRQSSTETALGWHSRIFLKRRN
jgi:hypothetical protein